MTAQPSELQPVKVADICEMGTPSEYTSGALLVHLLHAQKMYMQKACLDVQGEHLARMQHLAHSQRAEDMPVVTVA